MMSEKLEGIPKIVDFGFAKIVGPNELLVDHYGSQGYVAPEILLKEQYTKAVDVWSMGVVLYVLLSGALPFASFNREEMDRQVINENVPFDEPCFKNCNPHLKSLLLKMLEKDKEERPSIDQILEHPFFELMHKKEVDEFDLPPLNASKKNSGAYLQFRGDAK